MRPLRLAVVGAGRLGGFHAQKAVARGDVALVGVADPVGEQRHRLAAECGCRAVADYRELISQIDAAVVAAPTCLHRQIGLDLLEAGVHVLMEKPLARSGDEAKDLLEAAVRSNVILQVGHVERFNPAFAAAAPHLRDAKYVEAVRSSGFTFRSTDVGVVLDLMIHDLDLVLSLIRSPICRIDAIGISVLGGHEDVANARIEFQNGSVAVLNASRVSYESVRRMHVWSPTAMTVIDFGSRTTSTIEPSASLLRREFDADSLSPEQVEHYRKHLLEEHLPLKTIQSDPVDALAAELDDFVASIRMPRAPRVSGEDGSKAVGVAERILASIATHRWEAAVDAPVPQAGILRGPHWHMAPHPAPVDG